MVFTKRAAEASLAKQNAIQQESPGKATMAGASRITAPANFE
jgi:hypothetical protein